MVSVPRSQAPLRLVPVGEQTSFLDDVYRRYCRYVAAVVLRLDGRQTEVDDIVQEVFVEAARGVGRLRDAEAVKGWLATITVRVVRHRLRARRLRRFLGLDAQADYAALVDPSASPLDKLLVRAVYRVLDELPVDDRLAFTPAPHRGREAGCGRAPVPLLAGDGEAAHRARAAGDRSTHG